ncbi:transglutaminase-like domain-containing protein [Desulfomonile tiedjei]|uniref:Transglutaminase-like enzyme, predicted cysteine protease n=1 Tax=Desulfomonile tiedjei (strain ATCC 49306 / DSM 6799 / DCB-1) TaxID=706587 RepID=I4C407_DESTA|nr:transglutaminase-like domain-containing protein [Desulfomonile tiedjei]AFM24298.1 transglutaminase-like enzyme, predicted cysteine protease [Desulfomonile tiedjei DSM 6799]
MIRQRVLPVFIFAAALMISSCMVNSPSDVPGDKTLLVQGCKSLDKIPFKEAWYGTYFKEDRIGYSHFKIEPDGKNFIIHSDSVTRLTALKKTNEIVLNEKVRVMPDLALLSIDSKVRINGKDMHMIGKLEGKEFRVDIEVDGEKHSRAYKVEGKIHHSSAISLMPIIRGLRDGEKYSFGIFNAEGQELETVQQEINTVPGDPGPNGAVWKIKNHCGRGLVLSWLNNKGLTVLEKGVDGSLITVLEDESSARKFLEKKTSGKDLILDVSRIKVAKTIPHAGKLRYLKAGISGIDSNLLARDHRQDIIVPDSDTGRSGFEITVHVEPDRTRDKRHAADSFSPDDLNPTMVIQSDHPEIVSQAREIVERSDTQYEKIRKLVKWTAENIESKMQDSFTAIAVLRSREGECQAHANLYAALARSLHIPTRIATGIVYSEDVGFLYHAWAESFVDGWLAVDPTLNQVPADPTHIKIASRNHSESAQAILKMVGNLKLDVLDYR